MKVIKKPYHENADELSSDLAEQIYDSIRKCDTDICDIAENNEEWEVISLFLIIFYFTFTAIIYYSTC